MTTVQDKKQWVEKKNFGKNTATFSCSGVAEDTRPVETWK